ncbi:MAG: DNA polymerase III subunit delta [Gemmatimonadetes bacterium]|jgi:DNA polymerase III delta subunit|nr:DNA polymerase III subunit delta [Gemmatimonadota bacterium]
MSRVSDFIDSQGLGGTYFLHGDDEYRKQESVQELINAHLDQETKDFNLDIIRASEVDLEHLARTVSTPPMSSEWRVVVVLGVQYLAGTAKSRDLILDLAEGSLPGLVLVFSASIPKGSKAKFYSSLQRKSRVIQYDPIRADDVPGWLMEQGEQRFAMKVEAEAAVAMAAAVGADLGVLSQELEKLVALAGGQQSIKRSHVEAAGITLSTQNRWQWFDLVGKKKFEKAIRGLPLLLTQGENGVGLTIGLSTHLLRIGLVLEGGAVSLEGLLPPHQKWLAREIVLQAKEWSKEEICSALIKLLRVDRLLKASTLSDQHHLEEWLLTLRFQKDAIA